MVFIGFFFAAVFLFNGIPHFVQGICGKSHMTPFSRKSHPVTNVLWGLFNFGVGEVILHLSKTGPWQTSQTIAFWLGAIIISLGLSIFWSNPNAKLPWHSDQAS
ncbi:MAG: hypothetical protein V2J25_00870 [Desulfatiglans sp.]|jgi:hypothetical protein|nr:hypothetical protein [Thermodesulfobacteriota bacterium]MEE4351396.1 hypothetical protein [Desulfatiglans sp.]